MDGNRRWARERGLPSFEGHRAGLQRLVDLLPRVRPSGIDVLTIFAFATANWQREDSEVANLLRLADYAMRRFTPVCRAEGIRVEVIGRKDRLPDSLLAGIERTQRLTAGGDKHLRIALDYSARDAIVEAARQVGSDCDAEEFSRTLAANCDTCNVDLLIRTGKEQRLSDFMLWECAFAELYFPDLYWPEFTSATLDSALDWFQQRDRRFGV
jgi:undecaprenyl diphosphate synthase